MSKKKLDLSKKSTTNTDAIKKVISSEEEEKRNPLTIMMKPSLKEKLRVRAFHNKEKISDVIEHALNEYFKIK